MLVHPRSLGVDEGMLKQNDIRWDMVQILFSVK
jgi:hypothetical protein